jgi:hypothetical protein
MANPNIVNISSVLGKTATQAVTDSATAIVQNAGASNTVVKINTLIVSNISSNTVQITADHFRSNTAIQIASNTSIETGTSIVIISKDSSIYLEEGDDLRLTGSANSVMEAVCSYEEIS